MAVRSCSACGASSVAADSRFCDRCGAPMLAGPPAPAPPAPPTAGYMVPAGIRGRGPPGRTAALIVSVVAVVLVLSAAVIVAALGNFPNPGGPCHTCTFTPTFPTIVLPQGRNYPLAPNGYVDALLVGNGTAGNRTELFGTLESAGTTPFVALVFNGTEFAAWEATPGSLAVPFLDRGAANGSQLLPLEFVYDTPTPAYLVLWNPTANQTATVTVIESVAVMPSPLLPPGVG